jgi:hypothetical protein
VLARTMPAATIVDRELLAVLGFTDHAVQRFAQRTGLGVERRGAVEPVMRDLLLQEGRVVARRPRWARSRNEADLYLQVGEWLLFVCRGSRRRLGSFDVVTVINSGAASTWEGALERGLVWTPPPLRITKPRRARVSLLGSAVAALRNRRRDARRGLLVAIATMHRERRRERDATHAAALAAYERTLREHAAARERAHAAHLRRHG